MLSVKECYDQIHYYYKEIFDLNQKMDDVKLSPLKKDRQEERYTELRNQIYTLQERIQKLLNELVTFPPFHHKHADKLEEFHQDGPFERSVFIMTKFPEEDEQTDAELQRVIDAVVEAVKECNFIPRIASDKEYKQALWDNVELHLIGCKQGIAIVESKYKPELNPNVMMEWGWMRGMGRPVYYLIEKSFNFSRADISGLLKKEFDWNDPAPAIKKAIKGWLIGKTANVQGANTTVI